MKSKKFRTQLFKLYYERDPVLYTPLALGKPIGSVLRNPFHPEAVI